MGRFARACERSGGAWWHRRHRKLAACVGICPRPRPQVERRAQMPSLRVSRAIFAAGRRCGIRAMPPGCRGAASRCPGASCRAREAAFTPRLLVLAGLLPVEQRGRRVRGSAAYSSLGARARLCHVRRGATRRATHAPLPLRRLALFATRPVPLLEVRCPRGGHRASAHAREVVVYEIELGLQSGARLRA